VQGVTGPTGATGSTGSTGATGATGTMSSTYQTTEPVSGTAGQIWIDSDSDALYNFTPVLATLNRWRKTVSGGQTSLTGADDNSMTLAYTPGEEQVFLNGVMLVRNQDYTGADGVTIGGLLALSASDVVEVHSRVLQGIADTYTQAQSDARYVNKSSSGLNLVIPTSVVVGSGSSSVSANGTITFTGASSVSINGCFSSTYDNYRIILDPTASVGTDSTVSFRYRASGSDFTSGNYLAQRLVCFGSTVVTSTNVTGNTLHSLSLINSAHADLYYSTIEVHGPFLNRKKVFRADIHTMGSSTTFYLETHTGYNELTTPADGFSIILNAGSITGAIRIYGYNNGA
jgi:hypothetical protein